MPKRLKWLYDWRGKLTMALLAVLFFFVGRDIPFAEQKDFIDNIRDVSSIIFGVCGAWLALSYPKAIGLSKEACSTMGPERNAFINKAENEIAVLKSFVSAMVICTLIITTSLAIPYAKTLILAVSINDKYIPTLRGLNFSIIFFMASIQITILFSALINSLATLKDIDEELGKAKIYKTREDNVKY